MSAELARSLARREPKFIPLWVLAGRAEDRPNNMMDAREWKSGGRAGKSGLRCGGIQRSHNEMDGYAEERRGKFIRFRFAKMAKRLSYWRKRVCVSEVEGISNVVRHCAKCEKPNPLTSTDAVAERGMHARSPFVRSFRTR